LARTGLIFTGIQEGAQPGGLTPPGQTEPGIPYHVPSCGVPVGGAGQRELTRCSGARGGGSVRENGSLGRVFQSEHWQRWGCAHKTDKVAKKILCSFPCIMLWRLSNSQTSPFTMAVGQVWGVFINKYDRYDS